MSSAFKLPVTVVAAVVDKQQLTMYREDGTSIIIQQGDPRIRPLVEKVVPALEANGSCELTEEDFRDPSTAHFDEAEKELEGIVRFFRVMKEKAMEIMAKFASPVEPMAIGSVPAGTESKSEDEAPLTRSMTAVAEIMANAIPMASPTTDKDSTTVIAVVDDNTMIEGVEQIDIQIKAIAAKLGSPQGLANFFRRVSKVERAHSVQDLLKFMEKGELPIADDGTVLVYKRLKSTDTPGVFVDCHTGKVQQRLGSFVCMDEKLVDPNRSNECSNGLHVARRDYLSSFSGDVCVLAKMAPEDVIAVPHRDSRKLRCRGYHIIAVLSKEDHDNVISNRPLADKTLLGNAVVGNHVGVLERVEITQHKGGGVVITPMEGVAEAPELKKEHQAESLDVIPEVEAKASSVDARALATELGKKTAGSARQNEAKRLLDLFQNAASLSAARKAAAIELLAFKKKAKVGWAVLGLTNEIGAELLEASTAEVVEPKPKAVKPAAKNGKPASKASEAVSLWAKVGKGNKTAAKELLAFKKKAKKGWEALGLPANAGEVCQKLVG